MGGGKEQQEQFWVKMEGMVERLLDNKLGVTPNSHDQWKREKLRATNSPQQTSAKPGPPEKKNKGENSEKAKEGKKGKSVAATTLNPPANRRKVWPKSP